MNRRAVLVSVLPFAGLAGCSSEDPDPPRESETTIERCEEAYLRERRTGDPDSSVVSTETSGDWRQYTVESEWSHSYRDGEGNQIIADHYEMAYYHVSEDRIYRTEEADPDPTSGRQMEC